jgi:hypothetical protein
MLEGVPPGVLAHTLHHFAKTLGLAVGEREAVHVGVLARVQRGGARAYQHQLAPYVILHEAPERLLHEECRGRQLAVLVQVGVFVGTPVA